LGFAHNFAASANLRTSVMDYPHPNIEIQDGKISIANAYEVGIGDWDKVTVAYAYSDFPEVINEKKALNSILNQSADEGHRFISDQDARPIGGAHPKAHLWDNAKLATDELNHLMKIRKQVLEHLSLNHLREGEPYSALEDRFVPMYLLHRYQAEAAVKLIGGVDYDYAVKGTRKYQVKTVDGTIQRNALMEFLGTLSPEALVVPKELKKLIPPRSFSNSRTRENFLSQTGVTFDYLGIANSLSDALIGMLLHPERANRLVTQYGHDPSQLSLEETLSKLINNHFKEKPRDRHYSNLNDIVKANILKHIMFLALYPQTNPIVKAVVYKQLINLERWLSSQEELDFSDVYRMQINRYFDRPNDYIPPSVSRLPDGSPIGSFSCDF
jgi:hypothetical protein